MATATNEITVTVEKREPGGKGAAGRMRRDGLVPAVVYGAGKPTLPISVHEKDIKDMLRSASGENTIFLLKLKGAKEERRAMICDLQVDPLTGRLIHLDFIRVVKGQKLTVDIPVHLEGDSVGVRHGGRLDFVTRELRVEVLPRHMFDGFTVDISELDVGDNVTIGELASQLPESGRFLDEDDRVVVLVEAPRKEEPEEGEEDEDELAAELEGDEAAEPEVIGRSKGDDEESDD